jgi:hypothetical protein
VSSGCKSKGWKITQIVFASIVTFLALLILPSTISDSIFALIVNIGLIAWGVYALISAIKKVRTKQFAQKNESYDNAPEYTRASQYSDGSSDGYGRSYGANVKRRNYPTSRRKKSL